MTRERLEELNSVRDLIDQLRKDIDAIENGPYGTPYHHLEISAGYPNDLATDHILTISEDEYPELKRIILSALKGKLLALERELEEA